MIDSLTRPFRGKTVDDIYINISHFLDHFIMLIFAKAAFDAGRHFGFSYDEIIVYGAVGFVLFGGMAPIAAQLADRFSRSLMMVIFHFGIGFGAIMAGISQSISQLITALGVIGIFAAIYHPVGITMVIEGGGRVGWRLGINGVWGNMGVAAAPLITGFILAAYDWRLAFLIPGVVSIAIGIAYWAFVRSGLAVAPEATAREKAHVGFAPGWQRAMLSVALVTIAGGFVFGSMTFIIPRMFEVRLPGVSTDIAITGLLAGIVYAVAAFAQMIVGRAIDKRRVKPILLTVALGQPIFIGLLPQSYLLRY